MSEFLRKGDLAKTTDERVLVLPPKYRPELIMLHSRHYPGDLQPYRICRVMPDGEVFRFEGAKLEDVAIILIEHYGVDFTELKQIWDLEDAVDDS